LAEANELFEGWGEHPPTNLLVKAIVEGFGGTRPGPMGQTADVQMPPAAAEAMEKAALAEIRTKGAGRIPIIQGRDKGLPKAPPVFDLDKLRERNGTVAKAFRNTAARV